MHNCLRSSVFSKWASHFLNIMICISYTIFETSVCGNTLYWSNLRLQPTAWPCGLMMPESPTGERLLPLHNYNLHLWPAEQQSRHASIQTEQCRRLTAHIYFMSQGTGGRSRTRTEAEVTLQTLLLCNGGGIWNQALADQSFRIQPQTEQSHQTKMKNKPLFGKH